MTFVTFPFPLILVNYNYGAQSLSDYVFFTWFITKDLLHIALLRKSSEAVMCSLIHMMLCSHSWLFFGGFILRVSMVWHWSGKTGFLC